jgi:phage terminase large subunit
MSAQEAKRVLCLREFMNSIDDSVHAALKDNIVNLGMEPFFQHTNNQITCPNGSVFKYASLARNLSSIKSKHDFDIAWVEEAETITEKSLDVLMPTIRKSGSELWFSFNPDDEFGAVYSRFVKPHLAEIESNGFYEDDELYVCKVNMEDNPFAPDELKALSASMKETDYKKWLHIWGGEVHGDYSRSIIQPEWVDAAIDAHLKIPFEPVGVKSLGFDPADEGKDAKAIMLRHGSVITQGKQWFHDDIDFAIKEAFDCAYEWRAEHIVYDADGLGVSIKVGLGPRIEGKNIVVSSYRGNDSVVNPTGIYANDKTNKDTFRNKRAQYYTYLADRFKATYNAIEKGVYTNPIDMISLSSEIEDLDVLKSELVKICRKKGENSFIQMESKKDMDKSPNMADALVQCFANPEPEPEIIDIDFDSEF